MNVVHVLADGTVKADISGHVIKPDMAKDFYKILENINKRGKPHEKTTKENQKDQIEDSLFWDQGVDLVSENRTHVMFNG